MSWNCQPYLNSSLWSYFVFNGATEKGCEKVDKLMAVCKICKAQLDNKIGTASILRGRLFHEHSHIYCLFQRLLQTNLNRNKIISELKLSPITRRFFMNVLAKSRQNPSGRYILCFLHQWIGILNFIKIYIFSYRPNRVRILLNIIVVLATFP